MTYLNHSPLSPRGNFPGFGRGFSSPMSAYSRARCGVPEQQGVIGSDMGVAQAKA